MHKNPQRYNRHNLCVKTDPFSETFVAIPIQDNKDESEMSEEVTVKLEQDPSEHD